MAGGRVLVDRALELRVFDEEWSSGKPRLIVVYGRRRIGKTFLVASWARLRKVPTVYLVANYSEPGPALRDFEEQLEEQLGFRPRLDDVRGFVELLARLFCSSPRRLLVVDEFQRLAATGFPQLLQEAWDRRMAECVPGGVLVLTGSSIGVVERVALTGGAPLYGRASRLLRLSYMRLHEAYPFLERAADSVEAYKLYAVLGGVPYYLSLLEEGDTVEKALWRLVTSPAAPLQWEPLNLLRMELHEVDRYLAILEAIARGATRLAEIASATGLPATSLPKYLHVLQQLDLVEHVKPLGERRRGIYRVKDRLARLWLALVAPHRYLLELGLHEQLHRRVLSQLDSLIARAWEEDSLQHLLTALQEEGVIVEEAAPYWRRGVEIDGIVGVVPARTPSGEKRLYAVEAKWSSLTPRDVEREKARLEAKIEQLPWSRQGYKPVPVLYVRELHGAETCGRVVTLRDVLGDAARRATVTPVP